MEGKRKEVQDLVTEAASPGGQMIVTLHWMPSDHRWLPGAAGDTAVRSGVDQSQRRPGSSGAGVGGRDVLPVKRSPGRVAPPPRAALAGKGAAQKGGDDG